ncbi:response regulator [Candidatus Gracilibacteria bacterium]|nr:response regulator [Candidatus Gracilibacteria bacterium]NJM89213.1 response regulator [Hydrococcus sp. RU_2_2]NJP21853.1 response regulator [Hydrococcus sp. CRU_1_1]
MNTLVSSEQAKILVVDDHRFSRMAAVDLLSLDGYEVLEADDSRDVVKVVIEQQPDLILLDIVMPHNDGFEVCQRLKNDERTRSIPIIFITASDDRNWKIRGREVGGDDFLPKPLDRVELLTKVKLLIQQKRLNEGLDQTERLLYSIASAIEDRSEGGKSFARLEGLAQAFGEYLELTSTEISDLIFAARLHDVGTVCIPDAVLLKKGELTEEERELIKKHVLIGEKICQPMQNRRGVLPIIRHHHERWNGSGYPDGLSGDEIPWMAQIFQILDIYVALTSERPYKLALTPAQAVKTIAEEMEKGWRNPELVEQFTAFIQVTEMRA